MSGLKLKLGYYDYAGYCTFIVYALCSLSVPLVIVAMAQDLQFPLDKGGILDYEGSYDDFVQWKKERA